MMEIRFSDEMSFSKSDSSTSSIITCGGTGLRISRDMALIDRRRSCLSSGLREGDEEAVVISGGEARDLNVLEGSAYERGNDASVSERTVIGGRRRVKCEVKAYYIYECESPLTIYNNYITVFKL